MAGKSTRKGTHFDFKPFAGLTGNPRSPVKNLNGIGMIRSHSAGEEVMKVS